MSLEIKDYLTLDEQIQEWYSSSEDELNKLAKYLEEKIGQQVAEAFDEGYKKGFKEGFNDDGWNC